MCKIQKCFSDYIVGSPDSVQINALLEASTAYIWELVDGFGNIYHSAFTTNSAGIGSLDMADLPAGFANVGQATLSIRIKASADACEYEPFVLIQYYESIHLDFKAGSAVKDWVSCPIVLPSAGEPVQGFYLISETEGMPTVEEIEAGTPFEFTDGGDFSIEFPSSGWLKVFEPETQPEKTKNIDPVFGTDEFGPDGTFAVGQTVGSYRGYLSNYQTGTSTIYFNQ